MVRWANPYRGSGVGWRDEEAKLAQRLEPEGGVALHKQRFIVGGAIPVMFAPLEHEEDGAQDLVPGGDNHSFVATSNDERLEL